MNALLFLRTLPCDFFSTLRSGRFFVTSSRGLSRYGVAFRFLQAEAHGFNQTREMRL
jgi:hypothetical protein